MNTQDALSQILLALPSGIMHARLRVMQGGADGSDGESYLLVCAGRFFEDKVVMQIHEDEYEVISHLFPNNGSDLSEPVPMTHLLELIIKSRSN
jgi:hypothetical protein